MNAQERRRPFSGLLYAKLLACAWLPLATLEARAVVPGTPGDYDQTGYVSHADYSVLGDTFGSMVDLHADGDGSGEVDLPDYLLYEDNYGAGGGLATTASVLPLTLTPMPTAGGDVEWTIAFSNVSGALAGHMLVDAIGADILSATAGASFMDTPGDLVGGWETGSAGASGTQPSGVQISGVFNEAYAALGTTLGLSFFNDTLTFLTVVTEGQQTTTLTVRGAEYGYGGTDYFFAAPPTATFIGVPEPSSLGAACVFGSISLGRRRRRNR